ncbi:MAG: hypothetical protein ACYS1A_13540 [Planctomycetota bacterium]|jgi:hypothetical protein
MRENKIKFKVGKIKIETDGCKVSVTEATQKLAKLLKNLKYEGTLRESNSRQLNIHFDDALLRKLKKQSWSYSENPSPDMSILGEDWGNPKSDFIAFPFKTDSYRIVVEIEKANKKTIWFDFIKLWMFVEANQAEAGVLLCPFNYSHRHGVWNLFDEACHYKRYLRRFAGVPRKKLDIISIIGYQQMVYVNNKYKPWNDIEFNKIKEVA